MFYAVISFVIINGAYFFTATRTVESVEVQDIDFSNQA